MEKTTLVKVTEWAGNEEDSFAIKYGDGFDALFSFIAADGSVGDSVGVACPAKWETADPIDVPETAFEEVCYLLEAEN